MEVDPTVGGQPNTATSTDPGATKAILPGLKLTVGKPSREPEVTHLDSPKELKTASGQSAWALRVAPDQIAIGLTVGLGWQVLALDAMKRGEPELPISMGNPTETTGGLNARNQFFYN